MGAHRHRLTEKDFEAKTAVCSLDGPVELAIYGNTYSCRVAYRENNRRERKDRGRGRVYRKHKTDTCARCGFKALTMQQMDIDHINEDRSDHREENLQTLCANCHRLKTFAPELL